MRCEKCGNEISTDERFCRFCGTENNKEVKKQDSGGNGLKWTIPSFGENSSDVKDYESQNKLSENEIHQMNKNVSRHSTDVISSEEMYRTLPSYDMSSGTYEQSSVRIMSTWRIFGLLFVSSIPVIGLIVLIIYALGSEDPSRAYICRALLLWQFAGVILFIILVVFGGIGSGVFYAMKHLY